MTKIFCIGRNKTGTTSLKKAFEDLGYNVGHQRTAENLFVNYIEGDFDSIIEYCETAHVFQDFPFSWPETYKYLDEAFPNSKFILTVRDNAEQWYNSITNFHSKLWADGERIPTKQDLINANYIFKGRPWLSHKYGFGINGENTYDKEILINHYYQYNIYARSYFENRSNDFLEINLSEPNAYYKFCDFIGEEPLYSDFPWENKTKDISKNSAKNELKRKLKRSIKTLLE